MCKCVWKTEKINFDIKCIQENERKHHVLHWNRGNAPKLIIFNPKIKGESVNKK